MTNLSTKREESEFFNFGSNVKGLPEEEIPTGKAERFKESETQESAGSLARTDSWMEK